MGQYITKIKKKHIRQIDTAIANSDVNILRNINSNFDWNSNFYGVPIYFYVLIQNSYNGCREIVNFIIDQNIDFNIKINNIKCYLYANLNNYYALGTPKYINYGLYYENIESVSQLDIYRVIIPVKCNVGDYFIYVEKCLTNIYRIISSKYDYNSINKDYEKITDYVNYICNYIRITRGDHVIKSYKYGLPPPPQYLPLMNGNSNVTIAGDVSQTLLENEADLNKCIICFEEYRNILLEPCNHLVCCESCISKLSNCPMCQKIFSKYRKIYW